MRSLRHQSRIAAVQMLYPLGMIAAEIHALQESEVRQQEYIDQFWEHFEAPLESRVFADELFRSVLFHMPAIDALIQANTKNWKMERISKIDLAILRLAIVELRFLSDLPVSVVINEAISLAKEFSTLESANFINGLLAVIVPSSEPGASIG